MVYEQQNNRQQQMFKLKIEHKKRVCQNDAPLFLLLYVHRNLMQPNLNDFHHKVSLGFSISFEKGY